MNDKAREVYEISKNSLGKDVYLVA